jgi:glyoxylase-like metal-dependent hydrolase (beta-lactamase superfamily II)
MHIERLLAVGATVAASSLLLASCASAPQQDAAPVVARASQAMGAAQLNTLRYVAEGTGYTFGQAYEPGGAWPRIALHSVTRSIDYASGAMRDEVVLSRAEPLGGGGYPLSGQQRNDQFVSGELAWNQSSTTATPGPRFVTERIHQLWITPHGALKAAARVGARARPAAAGATAVDFEVAGRFTATAFVDADGLVRRVESVVADPVLGDTPVITTYQEYRAVDGVQMPMLIRQTMGGFPVLDLAIKEVQVNPSLALPVPDAAKNTAERVTSEKVADGVWFVAGGSHNSVAIELQDRIVLVETPLNDARTLAVIEHVKTLAPGKPIKTVVNSHAHFDHAGGVRAAVAEGATIVTQAANLRYFERAFAQANAIRPDAYARAGKKPEFIAVGDKLDIGDAARPIEVHRIVGGPHSASFVMVYLPKERLLIEADAFTPAPPNTPPPAVANANNVNLVDNIERLKLDVDRILPLHGRVVPAAELYAATQRTPR